MNIDQHKLTHITNQLWENSIQYGLSEFVKIPCKAPAFDPHWQENGKLEEAANLVGSWAHEQHIKGLRTEVLNLEGRTPLLFIEIPGFPENNPEKTVAMYGHLDKMPEAEGWREGLGPWQPVIEGDWLYGRGAADNGFGGFAYLSAIKSLQELNIPHARCVILLECTEECGSYDLGAYLDHLEDRIGEPSLVLCLDSSCGNYDQLWLSTSVRGSVTGILKVDHLEKPVHSGCASGAVPSTFRILRQLLSRIEDETTGEILSADFNVEIPQTRIEQAKVTAKILEPTKHEMFPLLGGCRLTTDNMEDILLNTTWKPAMSIVGAAGIPDFGNAAMVVRTSTAVQLSIRIPPGPNPQQLSQKLKELFETNPPYNAKVIYTPTIELGGWNAPDTAPWLQKVIDHSSQAYFGENPAYFGIGGSIVMLLILAKKFPKAQFFLSGPFGPNSNIHGPNEALHIPTAKKLICCAAEILAAHRETK